MKNKFTKILTTTILSAVSATAIGCNSTNAKLAKNIDKSMAEFVSSINNLDYVDVSKSATSSNEKIGKIVETSSNASISNSQSKYLNKNLSQLNVENTITRPVDRSDNFSLFVLSESPYISISSEDNAQTLNLNMKFSTNKIEETSSEINEKINKLILNRSILMIYVNEIYNNNVNLTEENKVAINAYVNVIKENTSFLNGNRGMVKNQLGLATDLATTENNNNLINYYIIKSGEALETRASKIESSLNAINSIISIIETNLSESSNFYNTNLSGTYNGIFEKLETTTAKEITKDSTNKEVAESIANSLGFCETQNKTSNNEPATLEQIQSNPTNNLVQNTQQTNNYTQNEQKSTHNSPAQNDEQTLKLSEQNKSSNNNVQTQEFNTGLKLNNNQTNQPTTLELTDQNNRQSVSANRRNRRINNRNTSSQNSNEYPSTPQTTHQPQTSEFAKPAKDPSTRNQTTNQNASTNENKTISPQGESKMQNKDNVFRAIRNPNNSPEELNSTTFSNDHRPTNNHASRVPYRTMSTFDKK